MEAESVLEDWAKKNRISLFEEAQRSEMKFFYVSNASETLQFVLEDCGENYRLDLWSVETDNDEEMHLAYIVPKADLERKLDELVTAAKLWLSQRVPIAATGAA